MQLGAQSEYPRHHDPRVRTVDAVKEKLTKIRKYTNKNKQDAFAAKKKRNNCARRERCCCTMEHLMATNEEIE